MYDDKNNSGTNAGTNAGTNTGTTPPDQLLDELTTIKDLLGGEHAADIHPADIPVLDDVVGTAQPRMLDIAHIFDEDEDDPSESTEIQEELPFPFPKFTLDVALSDSPAPAGAIAASSSAEGSAAEIVDNLTDTLRANYRRELLIQELVDEFLPRIEATLRERLAQLDHDALQALSRRD